MPETEGVRKSTEAVGLFHSADDLQSAIDKLLFHGFDRAEISVLASEETIAAKLGHRFQSVRELEDDPAVPTTAFVPKESEGGAEGAVIGAFLYIPAVAGTLAIVASGGALAAAIAAAAIGAGLGAGIGGILARLIDRRYAQQIEAHLATGGLLLWVRTRNKAHEDRAVDILKGQGAEDVHVHALPRLEIA